MARIAKHGYLTPMAAIRAKCMDCCCFQQTEVRECPATDCPLHPYRMGKNPKRTSDDTSTFDQMEGGFDDEAED